MKRKELLKNVHELENDKLLSELQRLEEVEYGVKELIHGILIGIIVGFLIALLLLR